MWGRKWAHNPTTISLSLSLSLSLKIWCQTAKTPPFKKHISNNLLHLYNPNLHNNTTSCSNNNYKFVDWSDPAEHQKGQNKRTQLGWEGDQNQTKPNLWQQLQELEESAVVGEQKPEPKPDLWQQPEELKKDQQQLLLEQQEDEKF